MRLEVTRPARARAWRCAVAVGWATPSLRAMNTTHTPSSTRSPSRCGGKCALGSFSQFSTCSRFWLASAARTAVSSTGPSGQELAASDHDGRATHRHFRDLVRVPLHPRIQDGRAADLLALPDLDLLAEPGPAVPGQMHG